MSILWQSSTLIFQVLLTQIIDSRFDLVEESQKARDGKHRLEGQEGEYPSEDGYPFQCPCEAGSL